MRGKACPACPTSEPVEPFSPSLSPSRAMNPCPRSLSKPDWPFPAGTSPACAEAHALLPANSSFLCHLYLPFTVLGNPSQTVQPPWAPVATPHPSPISPPP